MRMRPLWKGQGKVVLLGELYLSHIEGNIWLWGTVLLLSRSVVSDSVRPHRRQPTSLHRPWDSPGKNTGVGCHFLLQCMKVKSESEVAHNEYSGLISFKIDWFDLLAVQGTLKSLLQHHSSKASIRSLDLPDVCIIIGSLEPQKESRKINNCHNSPNLVKNRNLQIQKVQQAPNQI